MSEEKRTEIILPRREALRVIGGGALLLIGGDLLTACGSGSSGSPGVATGKGALRSLKARRRR